MGWHKYENWYCIEIVGRASNAGIMSNGWAGTGILTYMQEWDRWFGIR